MLEFQNVSYQYPSEDFDIIDHLSFAVEPGSFHCIIGISGCGKSTIFRMTNGLLKPKAGTILVEGKSIVGRKHYCGYMPQKDLLFPFCTIEDNVALPLIVKGVKKKEARQQAGKYFAGFGLEGTQKKYPAQLSGGMRQRAALLRTYLFSGSVALLDEPFSALDMLTKQSVHGWYLDVMEQIRLSTLFITHDIDEAVLLSDRIYLLTGKPGTITGEIVIKEPKPRAKDFQVTEAFLEYKKTILNHLRKYSDTV